MIATLMRTISAKAPVGVFRFLTNFWWPYLGSGIKVLSISSDFRAVSVCLKRAWYNSNYVGVQYGGSIYSMTDPFYMLMIMNNLGTDYIVWDKAAKIDFLKPGRTRLVANFKIDEELLAEIRKKTEAGEKYVFDLPVDVVDATGERIAHVIKTLYVRRKS